MSKPTKTSKRPVVRGTDPSGTWPIARELGSLLSQRWQGFTIDAVAYLKTLLGEGGPVGNAEFEETKHPRDHGKFAHTTGTGDKPSPTAVGAKFSGTIGNITSKGVSVKDDGTDLSVHMGTSRTLDIPGYGPVDTLGPVALVDARREKGQITLLKAHADQELQGKGIPRALIGDICKVALKEGLPVRTTGVFSDAGRTMMDKMVRDGLARKLNNGDYELAREKLVLNISVGDGPVDDPTGPNSSLWEESKVRRSTGGKFGTKPEGGGGEQKQIQGPAEGAEAGGGGDKGGGEDAGGKPPDVATADKAAAGVIGQSRKAIAKVLRELDDATEKHAATAWANKAAKWCGAMSKHAFDWLSNRYGIAVGGTIFASGTVVATAIQVGSAAVLGFPIWFPGMGTLCCLPALAIAETYKQIKDATTKKDAPTGNTGKPLTDKQLVNAGSELVKHVSRKFNEWVINNPPNMPSKAATASPTVMQPQKAPTGHPNAGKIPSDVLEGNKAGPFKFTSTMVMLPPEIAEVVLAMAHSVHTWDLADDGREDDPHITVKYGLHNDDPLGVISVVRGYSPATITLGGLSLFETPDYDVLKMEVLSPDLHALNDAIGDVCDHTDTYPVYQPHITLAYVQSGKGQEYIGMSNPLEGRVISLGEIVHTNRAGDRAYIPLLGTSEAYGIDYEDYLLLTNAPGIAPPTPHAPGAPKATKVPAVKAEGMHKEGDKWQGQSGRWFTLKSYGGKMRVVPTKAPEGGQGGGGKTTGDKPPVGGGKKKVTTHTPESAQKAIEEAMKAGGEGMGAAIGDVLKSMKMGDIRKMVIDLGLGVKHTTKAGLADKAAQALIAKVRDETKEPGVSDKPAPAKQDPDTLTKVKDLGGSTGATLMKDGSGNEWVIKKGASEGHIREESAADSAYAAAGILVPEHTLIEGPHGPVKKAKYMEGMKSIGDALAEAKGDAKEALLRQAQKGFVMDAVLGNWDVVGLDHDNMMVDQAGNVYRIDNGGSLRYRAQGAKKGKDQFGDEVKEMESMRDGTNAAAASVFKGMSNGAIAQQVHDMKNNKDKILAALPDDLKDIVGKRIDWVVANYSNGQKKASKPTPPKAVEPPKEKKETIDDGIVKDFTSELSEAINDADISSVNASIMAMADTGLNSSELAKVAENLKMKGLLSSLDSPHHNLNKLKKIIEKQLGVDSAAPVLSTSDTKKADLWMGAHPGNSMYATTKAEEAMAVAGVTAKPVGFPPGDQKRWFDPYGDDGKKWSVMVDQAEAVQKFDGKTKQVLAKYTGAHYMVMNLDAASRECGTVVNMLARGETDTKDYKREMTSLGVDEAVVRGMVSSMDAAMKSTPPLKEPTPMYRGIGLSNEKHAAMMSEIMSKVGSGEPMVFDAFTSVSKNPTTSKQFTMGGKGIRFEVMARHGVVPEASVPSTSEYEMILPRGSKFKVHGVVKVPGQYAGDPDEELVQIEQIL